MMDRIWEKETLLHCWWECKMIISFNNIYISKLNGFSNIYIFYERENVDVFEYVIVFSLQHIILRNETKIWNFAWENGRQYLLLIASIIQWFGIISL